MLESYGVEPALKWPNDVQVGGRKIAGILAETVVTGSEFLGLVLGIGVNLNLDATVIATVDQPATAVQEEMTPAAGRTLGFFLLTFVLLYRMVSSFARRVSRPLLAVNVAMIVGYMTFGRAADALQRRGRGALPLLLAGVALSSVSLGLVIVTRVFALWLVFVAAGTSVVLAYSILSRRLPKAMAGRANTAINVFGFVGMFSGQWGIGLVLDLWPQTAHGYAPAAYTWALGMSWAVQLAGLAWLWSGRTLLATRAA